MVFNIRIIIIVIIIIVLIIILTIIMYSPARDVERAQRAQFAAMSPPIHHEVHTILLPIFIIGSLYYSYCNFTSINNIVSEETGRVPDVEVHASHIQNHLTYPVFV